MVLSNVAFAASEHAGPLFRRMFPDSDTAQKYGCGHTKTACIIESLAKADSDGIAEVLKTSPFSIATDGGNDYGAIKLYLAVVRYFDDGRLCASCWTCWSVQKPQQVVTFSVF